MSAMTAPTLMAMGLFLMISRTEAGSQFVVIQEAKTWSDANDHCATTYGTSLATIRSQFDADDLSAIREELELGTGHIWIGMNSRLDSVWQWASGFDCGGDCADFELWAADLPYSKGQYAVEECTVYGTTGLIYDSECEGGQFSVPFFVCDAPVLGTRMAAVEERLTSVSSAVDAVESEADSVQNELDTVQSAIDSVAADMVSVLDAVDAVEAVASLKVGRYEVIVSSTTYREASDYCATTYGSTLATIRSDADAQDLWALTLALGLRKTWVGLTRTEGEWKWDSGYSCDGDCQNIAFWYDGEPQDSTNTEECTIMYSDGDNIHNLLMDRQCTNSYPAFACDSPVTGPRMAELETRLESLERIIIGFDAAIDAEQSVSAPVGFGVYADYALYALALANLVVLLCLFAFCMVRRVPTKVQYGRVYDTETETDKL